MSNCCKFTGGGSNIRNHNYISDLVYLNTKKQLKANIVNSSSAMFNNAIILQPSPNSSLPQTTVNNFDLYINGEHTTSVINFISFSDGVIFNFDTNELGYLLETDDEVIAIGKFQ